MQIYSRRLYQLAGDVHVCFNASIPKIPALQLVHMVLEVQLLYKIRLGYFRVDKFNLVILHCGTNDLLIHNDEEIICLLERIISSVKNKNSSAIIAISSIIQRPIDSDSQDSLRQSLSTKITQLRRKYKIEFIRTYRAFNA